MVVVNHPEGKTMEEEEVVHDEEEEMEEEPDSDAPEEASISKAKDEVAEENLSYKKELLNLKKKVKEARRLKHAKNREQQLKKKERMHKLEKCRLPADLLEAVANEEQVTVVKPKGKHKVFKEDDFMESFNETRNEEEMIPLDTGIEVKAVQQQVKKHESIASKAASFRQRALYVKTSNRISSKSQRQMLVKQKKAGKNLFVS